MDPGHHYRRGRSPCAQPPLNPEGGSTDISGWTVGGDSVDLTGDSYWTPEDGAQSIDLAGATSGSVAQTVTTTPGANYTLTWFMAGNPNCGQPVKSMTVSWNGTVIESPTFDTTSDSNASMGWVQQQINVTATGTSSLVEFADATPDMSQCGAAVDNVSLIPAAVAPPGFSEDSPPLQTLQGATYSAIFFAAGVPAYSLAAAPSWLSITPTGAVTGTPPAGTSTFTYSVSASNADGSATAGPYTVAVQSAASVTGSVTDGGIANNPVSGAAVQACVTGGGECQEASTAADGTYHVNAPIGSTIVISAYPHSGYGAVSVVGPNTQTGLYSANVTLLGESPLGSGNYSGVIPPQEPVHGGVEIDSSLACPPQSALLPSGGPATGGTTVLLNGSGFSGATAVSFGGTPATSFAVTSDQAIQAVAPRGTGTVPVSVSVGGSSMVIDQYTYTAIQAISPAAGPAAGGVTVVITGTGLGSATAVLFGTTGADFTQVSDTQIDAVSPPGTGVQDISVQTLYGGTTPVAAVDEFTYGSSGSAGESTSSVKSVRATVITAARISPAPLPTAQLLAAHAASASVSQVLNYILDYLPKVQTVAEDAKSLVEEAESLVHPNCETTQAANVAAIMFKLAPTIEALAATLQVGVELGIGAFLTSIGLVAVVPAVEEFLANPLAQKALNAAVFTPFVTWLAFEAVTAGVKVVYAPFCPGSFHDNTLVDPSGTVLDTNGNPVPGASTTILRADTSAGPFTPVDTTSPGVEPAVNPETTGADGAFHWDVDTGWYEVRAAAPGCTDPANPGQSTVTIGPYPVPPPQLGLTATLACPGEAPPPAPSITSLGATAGPASGGTTVTVLGAGFTPTSIVMFGKTAAQSVTYESPQAITVTSPPGSGQVDVTVQTAGGTSATSGADQFSYGSPPSVTGLSVPSGPAAGGTRVTISGSGFTGATAVGFGDVPATSVTVESDTQIQATTPAEDPGTVDVQVLTPAGASAQAAADRFTYDSGGGPVIDSQAAATGTTNVTARITTTSPGDLIVAFVAADGLAGTAQRAKVSGGGLAWTLARRANTRNGTAEAWVARASGALSRAAITSSLNSAGYGESLTVAAFSHASGIGQTASASGRTGAPAASLTAAAGSLVFGVGNDWTASVPRTLGAGQTLVSQSTDSAGDTYWVQSRSTLTPAAGTQVTINDTAPTTDMWNLALVEIL
jgi:choice-of-anchor C domain-containing protein